MPLAIFHVAFFFIITVNSQILDRRDAPERFFPNYTDQVVAEIPERKKVEEEAVGNLH